MIGRSAVVARVSVVAAAAGASALIAAAANSRLALLAASSAGALCATRSRFAALAAALLLAAVAALAAGAPAPPSGRSRPPARRLAIGDRASCGRSVDVACRRERPTETLELSASVRASDARPPMSTGQSA